MRVIGREGIGALPQTPAGGDPLHPRIALLHSAKNATVSDNIGMVIDTGVLVAVFTQINSYCHNHSLCAVKRHR